MTCQPLLEKRRRKWVDYESGEIWSVADAREQGHSCPVSVRAGFVQGGLVMKGPRNIVPCVERKKGRALRRGL